LTRRYGNLEALRGLNLRILPGETFGLLGPNGAGKSTTIKILATLLRPTSGTARLRGYDLVDQANDIRRIIGYVPEGADLYDALPSMEILDLVAHLHRLSPTEAPRRPDPAGDSFALSRAI